MAIKYPIVFKVDKAGLRKAEDGLKDFGKLTAGIAAAATAAVAGIAVKSVKEFANFDAALNQSIAIMGDVSDIMRGEMSDAAREVALATTFSAEQAAESFFFLASAGLNAEQAVAAMPQVAKFAQAGMFDMATATDLATDAQSALGLTSDDAATNLANLTRVTDVFVAANTIANTTVEQLASALTSKAGSALANVGKSVEEGSAALAVFADQGIKGERAGTLLTNTIFGLTERVQAAPEEFEKLGISIFDADENLNSFADISEDFTAALGDMSVEQQLATLNQLGFTKQSREGLLALLGQSDALRTYEDALRNAGGMAGEVAGKQLLTFNGQMALLSSAVSDVAIDIGARLVPIISDLIPVVERLLPKIGDELIAALDGLDFEGIVTGIGDFITFIAENIDKLDDFIVVLGLTALTIGGFTTAINIARTATMIFGITLAASLPIIGLIGAALGLLAGTFVAGSIAASTATESHADLSEELDNTTRRIKFLTETQEKQNNTLYAEEIKKLRIRQHELRIETGRLLEFTKESVAATDDARFASGAYHDQLGVLRPRMQQNADDYAGIAREAANAMLGVSQLSLVEQARAIQAEQISRIQLYGGVKEEAQSFQDILNGLTARVQFQTEAFHENEDEVKRVGAALGLVVPGMDSATGAMSGLAGSAGIASDSFNTLTSDIGKATEAANRFRNATPGSPGPGGMFEAIFPDGSKRLVNLEGQEFRGLSTGGQQLGRAAEVKSPFDDEFFEAIFPDGSTRMVNLEGEELKLAMGGIVTAPTRALIGEAGPEAVIPLDRLSSMMNGGNTVNVTINAGIGSDPVSIGREVVNAIKRYESVSGKVFASV